MATSERIEIRQTTIDKARRDAAAGIRRQVADIEARGLVLRVQPSGCVWQVRVQHERRAYRVTIGPVALWSLAHAREAARNVNWHITRGHGVPEPYWMKSFLDQALWLDRQADRKGKHVPEDPEPHRKVYQPRPERVTTWTYKTARDEWGAYLKAEAEAGNLSPETVKNYLGIVGSPAMRVLDPVRVASITDVDVDKIVQALVKAGKRSSARDVARVSKRMWKWLYRPANRPLSGVARGALADIEAPDLGNVKKRQRYPDIGRLGLVVATARSGALDRVISAAVELLAWTAQRRLTVVRAHVDEFEPWEARSGWGLWRVGHRKSHKPGDGTVAHTVPLPPPIWGRMQEHMEWLAVTMPGTEWLFPARREAKLGVPAASGHLGADTLTHVLPTIPGAGMTPHDVRRCFPTTLATAGHHLTFVGYVMDHLSLGSVTTRDENGSTRRYTEAEMLSFKAPVMETWEILLEPAARAAVLLPLPELKAEIARLRDERRGIDPAKEKVRLKAVNASAYAAGRTFHQRKRSTADSRRDPVGEAGEPIK